MSIPKYAAHRDQYEPEVIRAFRQGGAKVQPLSIKNAPDLLVGYLGVNHLVEVKTNSAMPTGEQKAWHDSWLGEPVVIARNAAQARKFLTMWARAFAERNEPRPNLEDDSDTLRNRVRPSKTDGEPD